MIPIIILTVWYSFERHIQMNTFAGHARMLLLLVTYDFSFSYFFQNAIKDVGFMWRQRLVQRRNKHLMDKFVVVGMYIAAVTGLSAKVRGYRMQKEVMVQKILKMNVGSPVYCETRRLY